MKSLLRFCVYRTQWLPKSVGVPLRRAARRHYHSAPGKLRPSLRK